MSFLTSIRCHHRPLVTIRTWRDYACQILLMACICTVIEELPDGECNHESSYTATIELPMHQRPTSPELMLPGPKHPPSPDMCLSEQPTITHRDYHSSHLRAFRGREDEERKDTCLRQLSGYTLFVDPVPSAGDTEAFETDESAPTPRPPQIRIPFAQTRLRPTDAGAPLGYRAAGIRMRAAVASPPSLLPPTSPRTDIPEADMPPRKRACLTTPAPGYEIGESSAAGAARQPRPTPEVDTWDEIVEAMMEIAPTTLEGVDQRVTELDTTCLGRTVDFVALAMDREAVYARIAWTSSEERSAAIEAHTQLTTALGRIATLEARDPEPQDGPAEAGSSS
ncbi:hypothetical protein Tco_1284766 [Tanacetum coccineum]